MAIRWWIKFSGIVTDETDFHRARRTVAAIGIPVSLVLVIVLLLFVVGIRSILR